MADQHEKIHQPAEDSGNNNFYATSAYTVWPPTRTSCLNLSESAATMASPRPARTRHRRTHSAGRSTRRSRASETSTRVCCGELCLRLKPGATWEAPMPDTARRAPKDRPRDYSRRREALVGVRLSPEELSTLKAVAARDGLSLPSALREGFLRYAEHCR
jgi:hypothetical protein